MAKHKVTITLDRAKADEARLLVGRGNTSEVIDVALGRSASPRLRHAWPSTPADVPKSA